MNQYKTRTIKCKGCGKIVTNRMPKNRSYCSVDCFRKSKKPDRRTGKIIQCEFCGRETYKMHSLFIGRKNHFCSCKCANAFQGRNKLSFICKTCGKKFRWSPSRIKQQNPTYCSIECRNADEEWIRKACINGNLIQQKKKGLNKIELLGRKILNDLNLEFDEQVIIADKFLVDVFVPNYNLIIQWDGDYWHCHPKYIKPDERQMRRKQIDRSQNKYFEVCGYKILRFWESEIKRETEDNDYIKRTIREIAA